MKNKPMLSVEREFKREDRYVVVKRSDLDRIPNRKVVHAFLAALAEVSGHSVRIPQRDFLVIESDWPEFDTAYQMIEARMTGQPAAQHKGDPVAEVVRLSIGATAVILKGHEHLPEGTKLYAEQPAPVAVMPFAEKVIGKLHRFQECTGDSQGVDIGRHWFDLLTQLGLLNRVQRSPALWEMTQQGEDILEVARINGVKM